MTSAKELTHIQASFAQLFEAIDLLIERTLIPPALVLIYSAMDSVAALARPASAPYVTREHFIKWVNTYLLTQTGELRCSALELYGARCGVLHTFAPESRLSDEGEARVIGYAWGKGQAEELREMTTYLECDETMVGVHVADLVSALKRGYALFLEDVHADPALEALVASRAKMLANLPLEASRRFLDMKRRR